ncbi:MAG: DMT family transporter [Hyphomicrobiaceae bacterium]
MRSEAKSSFADLVPFLLLATAALCWSGNHVIGRWVAMETPPVPPGGLSVLRWLLAILIVLPFSWRKAVEEWPQIRQRWGWMLLLGLLGSAWFSYLQYLALHHTTAINLSVLNSLGPALIILAGVLMFRDRVDIGQLAGILVSLIGVLIIVSRGTIERLIALEFNSGDLFGLATVVIWAVFSACLRMKPDVSPMTLMLAASVIGFVGNLPMMAIEIAAGDTLHATWPTAFAVLYVGIFSSVVAYIAWTAGVAALGSHRAGIFLHLTPLFSSILSLAFLGEQPMLYHAAGLVLIVAGVTIAARLPNSRR